MGSHCLVLSMQLRKLLQHFPRTYADLQNAQIGIDDGQYLISIGEVLSSRYSDIAPENFSHLFLIDEEKVGQFLWGLTTFGLCFHKSY